MGCHARPGFLVREAGDLEQLLCTLFQIQSAIGQDSRDAELVSFPAFECFPGWSISRISVLFTARVKAISLSMISSAIAAFMQQVY